MHDDVLLTRELLLIDGLTYLDLKRRERAGELEHLRRGAWAKARPLSVLGNHIRLATAVALQRPEVVLSHTTAALIWGLPIDLDALARVCVTRRQGHGRSSPRLHESSAPLAPHDLVLRNGLLITSPARTVVDVARASLLEWGVAAADRALHQGLCTRDELDEAVAQSSRRHGISKARRAVSFADPLAESPLESISRVQFSRMDIPMPQLQYPITLGDRVVARADFVWEEERVVGEADGYSKYDELLPPGQTTRDALKAEKAREQDIRDADWRIVRWGMDEALSVRRLAARVKPELAAARRDQRRAS